MSKKLITNNFKTFMGSQFIEAVTEKANSQFYVFISEHADRTTVNTPQPRDKVRDIHIDAYRNMICGKRVGADDVSLMVRNIPYQSKLFEMYDDDDNKLINEDYFCVVDEGAFHHVYKCLDNNMDSNSTVEPSFAHVTGANTQVYQTSDGYRWKYMYSIASNIYDKFATSDYIPVVANTTVIENAQAGKVEIVKIIDAGKNYGNYSNGTFGAGDIRVNGDSRIYEISNSDSVSTVNGFYTGCVLYLSSGTGSGQYRQITDYHANADGNFVQVNNAFSTTPTNGTTFDINPYVKVIGDGQETVNAEGRALINSLSTNSIYRIEMLSVGNNYFYATANAIANDAVGVTNEAEIRPIYPPLGGHGHDAASELACEHFALSTTFSNNENGTILEDNSFQQFGIICNPLFANVEIEHQGANGLFTENEPVYKVAPKRFATNASINTTTTAVVCDSSEFSNQVATGDKVFLESSNGTSHMLATIDTVTNATYMNMTVNGFFSCTEVSLYFPEIDASGVVNSITNASSMQITNVSGVLSSDDLLIGNTSGATLQINSISRNDTEKGFDTFIQMYKYTGSITSGEFEEDEIVYQGTNASAGIANGLLHSANTDGLTTFYVSNQVGQFSTVLTLNGNTSKASATVSQRYEPELVSGSGDVLFIENANTTNREDSQTFKLIFNL